MSSPPRNVPTLTEVVAVAPRVNFAVQQEDGPLSSQLIAAVMQEVDIRLEQRMREIVSRVVMEHVQGIVPTLHNEIENTVTELVRDALAKQLR